MFSSVNMPIKKLGLNFCLNRSTKLLYVKEPKFSEEDSNKVENYIQVLSKSDYVGLGAQFSNDFSKLIYIGSEQKFISHSA